MQNSIKSHLYFAAIVLNFSVMSCGLVCAQSEATSLAESAYKHSDTQLNEVYKKIVNKIPPNAKQGFVESQRAWIAFRDLDAKCRAGIASQGGSSYSTDYLAILTELTEQRVAHLKILLLAL